MKTFDVTKINCSMLLQFGRNDHSKGFSDPESAENLQKTMKAAGVDSELDIYENCGHAFMNRDRSDAFNKEGDK